MNKLVAKLAISLSMAAIASGAYAKDPILAAAEKSPVYQDFKRGLPGKCQPTNHKILVDSSQGNREGQATYLVVSNNEKCPGMQFDFKRQALLVAHRWSGGRSEVKTEDSTIQEDLERSLKTTAGSESCESKVRSTIQRTAQLMGFKPASFSFEMSVPAKSVDENGNQFVEYRTSLFFVDDGYVAGTGAVVRVKPRGQGCDLTSLTVATGN